MTYSIAQLNAISQAEFTQALGAIFENTPTIATAAWSQRPFADRAALQAALAAVVQQLDEAAQLTLIRAHPDLGAKAKMADASVQEQASAGLDRLTPAEYEQFQRLNSGYWEKFGFPFIIAVKQHSKASILRNFEQRLQNSIAVERQQAIAEILTIAQLRLAAAVTDDA